MRPPGPRDPSVVAIIQARMGSSRLPGKVLADIGGKPMLYRVIVRARRAQTLGRVVLATTWDASDDPVAVYCQAQGFPLYRGDPQDVLDRYYQAARLFNAHTVVRLTGDCPLIDPGEIDRTVRAFQASEVDFAANRLPPPWQRTTPIGMDTEVVSFAALHKAWGEADQKHQREHVMPYFYEDADRFNVLVVEHDPNLGHLRLTVDTQEDLALVRKIYAAFNNQDLFSLQEIVELLQHHPDWQAINAAISHKGYLDVDRRE